MFSDYKQDLIIYGFILYLLSLLLGGVLAKFKNPRMALSTHVTGLMMGIYSFALAAISNEINLTMIFASMAYYTHIVGNGLLVFSLGLAALWNTKSKTPIAGAKILGAKNQELVVKYGIILSSIMLVISAAILLYGSV